MANELAVPRTTRSKFHIYTIDNLPGGGVQVYLSPVVADGTKENDSFFESTPSGSISIRVKNEVASALFVQGSDMYVDFTVVKR